MRAPEPVHTPGPPLPSGRRRVAVTGSASGIGAACTERLAAGGTGVIGVDLHDADVVADLGTPDGRRAAVEGVAALAGDGLDVLVTCAGLAGAPSRPGSLVASVNYFGTVQILDGLRPLLGRGTTPAAVAISSNSTTIQPGVPMDLVEACLDGDEDRARRLADEAGSMAAYPATKLAVARWVRREAVSPAWTGAGIRLNAVAPGMVDTPLVAEGRVDPVVGPLLELFPIPAGRPGRPEEVAALVALLTGPEGGFFCGSVVFMDGGSDALLRGPDWPAPWDLDLPGPAE
jgi:NAD(P)-dependent dehydrogenase (short-subunit alcohol dehydrogenase family)